MLRQIINVLFIFSVSINWAQKTSQDYEQELKAQSNSIQSLRDEIESTKKRIQSENRKEKSSARRVNNLSEEISLLQRLLKDCLLYTSPSPRDLSTSRMPSSA